ncbi:MAG: sugar phosphate isomerase/epimerase [Nitrososphaerota archaeon]|jgi:sugar phosphate isomerase/epimerase|nr:sugar phosphate isomerase/epimerase [Nitrososphaerota archaeon]MDG6955290.1 sugar phosphate isomerase/epimerase [Nitrososphaerota archaeon]
MKLSAQENLAPGTSLRAKVEALQEAGYDGIELNGNDSLGGRLKEVKDELSTSRIRVSTICGGLQHNLLSPDPKERSKTVEEYLERLRWSAELGAVGFIMVPGFGPPRLPDLTPISATVAELEEKLVVEELKLIAKRAKDYGAFLLLEPLNRYETHFLKTVGFARRLIEEASSDNIRMMADFFHMNIEEADVADSVLKNLEYIKHFHAADSNRLNPGRGHSDFGVLKEVEGRGFSGYVALECSFSGDRREELAFTAKYLRKQAE